MQTMLQTLNQVTSTAKGVFYPEHCVSCQAFISLSESSPLCQECHKNLIVNHFYHPTETNWAFDNVFALFSYHSVAKKLIQKFKINDATHLKRVFKSLFELKAKNQWRELQSFDVIVPIPSHQKSSMWSKNTSETIAKMLSSWIHVPTENLLRRTRTVPKQSSLSRKMRLIQSSDSIDVMGTTDHPSVLLVDDIMTTGQTAHICAKMLKEHGVRNVSLFVLGRGI